MRMNQDLNRKILLLVEEKAPPIGEVAIDLEAFGGVDIDTLYSHVFLLVERGYLSSEPTSMGGNTPTLPNLTYAGHEYVNSIRDEGVWGKTKQIAAETGSFSMDLLKDIALGVIKTQIKNYSGIEV